MGDRRASWTAGTEKCCGEYRPQEAVGMKTTGLKKDMILCHAPTKPAQD